MFNRKAKKEAIERRKKSISEYESVSNKIAIDCTNWFDDKQELKKKINLMWDLINKFRNKPTEINTNLNKIKVEYSRFDDFVQDIKNRDNNNKTKNGFWGASFGAASVTALGTISAEATQAITMTTLASSGSGIVGTAILGTFGIAGLGMMATGVTVEGILESNKNKRDVQQANEDTEKIRSQIYILRGVMSEVSILDRQTYLASRDISSNYKVINDYSRDYNSLSTDEQYKLGTMVNDVLSYAKLLNKVVGQKA